MPRTRSVSRVTEQGRGDERGPLKKQRWSTVTVTQSGASLCSCRRLAPGPATFHIHQGPASATYLELSDMSTLPGSRISEKETRDESMIPPPVWLQVLGTDEGTFTPSVTGSHCIMGFLNTVTSALAVALKDGERSCDWQAAAFCAKGISEVKEQSLFTCSMEKRELVSHCVGRQRGVR